MLNTEPYQGGRTSGSRRKFEHNRTGRRIFLDEPHDGLMRPGMVRRLREDLIRGGFFMTIHSYKDYQGSIEYENAQIVIQLLHIDDFITTTCESAASAESAFRELVDDYLATCEETGRPPSKPYKGSLNIRMPAALHRRLAMAATAAGVSLNSWIVRACEAALAVPPRRGSGDEKYPAARQVVSD